LGPKRDKGDRRPRNESREDNMFDEVTAGREAGWYMKFLYLFPCKERG
jgi:hypothetical protein